MIYDFTVFLVVFYTKGWYNKKSEKRGINMANKCGFRSSINGFNKADVLDYIDAMQSRHIEEFNAAKKQIDDLHKAVNEKTSENESLKANLELLNSKLILMEEENNSLKNTTQEKMRYAADLRRLAEEVEVLRLEKKEHMERLAELQESPKAVGESDLRDEIESLKNENQQLSLLNKRLQTSNDDLKKQLSEVDEANKRYNGLVGDAGAFILEMYSMGQRFLETAYKRSDGCLNSMEESLQTLSAQAADARENVKKARQELLDYGAIAGLRLDELMQTLENSAGAISDPDEDTRED
jgi:chromosome segregation ATPase